MTTITRLEVCPPGPTTGADVGVDLQLSTTRASRRSRAPGTSISCRGSVTSISPMPFSRRFDEWDRAPVHAAGVLANDAPRVAVAPEARDYVNIISNVKVGSEPIGGLGNDGEPFADVCATYEALDAVRQRQYRLEDLYRRVMHRTQICGDRLF